MKNWSYGITTVPQRLSTTLPITLQSLAAAGFDKPRIFIDGDKSSVVYPASLLQHPLTEHLEPIHPTPPSNLGNWYLAIWELYLREPLADYFALFEDDILLCKNTKQYLEATGYPTDGYWNAYTSPGNIDKTTAQRGWNVSLQNGRGALALIFNRHSLTTLLSTKYFVEQPPAVRGWKNLDGTIVTAARNSNLKEYTHYPSLVLHQGQQSTMNHRQYPSAVEFPGEEFNTMEYLK